MIGSQKAPLPIESPATTGEQPSIVACLGSSSTAGKGQAFNWISELQGRLGQSRFVFRNFGVGGDLAYNALQRLSGVIASLLKYRDSTLSSYGIDTVAPFIVKDVIAIADRVQRSNVLTVFSIQDDKPRRETGYDEQSMILLVQCHWIV